MNPQAALYPGQVVQLSPFEAQPGFAGCFMVVAEVRAWGATGVVLGVGRHAPYELVYRARWEEMEFVGQAPWSVDQSTGRIHERLEEPKPWRTLRAHERQP